MGDIPGDGGKDWYLERHRTKQIAQIIKIPHIITVQTNIVLSSWT